MTKTEARKLAKACRAAVDLHTVGHAMAGVLFALPAWQHADTVLAFASMPDEPDTADILRLALAADLEVFQAPLGLGAPVMLRRDSNLAHGVVFHTGIHGPIPPDRKIVASIITGNSGVDKPRRHSAPASFSHPAGSSSPISRTE